MIYLLAVVLVLLLSLTTVSLDKLESIEKDKYNDINIIKSTIKLKISINRYPLRKLVPLMKVLIDWISEDQDS